MKTERELRVNFKLGKNPSEIDKLLYHIYQSQAMIRYLLRRGQKPHYYRKQIEVAKRRLKPFKHELHPIELRSINFKYHIK
jgi:hypothetical protein